MIKVWQCIECGYEYEGPKAPTRCPECGADCEAFELYEYEDEEEDWEDEEEWEEDNWDDDKSRRNR